MDAGPHAWIRYAITAAVVALVLFFRFRRAGVSRPLKVGRLWIIPLLYAVLAVALFATAPPEGPAGWAFSILALLAGCWLGWQRGKMMHIEVDPETQALSARQSPFAILFIAALILVRMVLRVVLVDKGSGAFHVSAATVTDVLVAFALGLLAVQRLEMYLRARRLLAASRSA